MDDKNVEQPSSQGELVDSDTITCGRCGEAKPRSQYRKVDNPTICLECYAKQRRKNKSAPSGSGAKASGSSGGTSKDGAKKPRATLHFSLRAQSVLTVLSIREKKSQSQVVEEMLLTCYQAMDSTEKQFVRFIEDSAAEQQ